MAHIDVNLNDPNIGGGENHPDGPLRVKVISYEIRENKAKDGTYINWRLDPVADGNKKPVWLMTSLKPKALFNLKEFLQACGFAWHADGTFDADNVLGAELMVTVSTEEYEGKMDNKVNRPYARV